MGLWLQGSIFGPWMRERCSTLEVLLILFFKIISFCQLIMSICMDQTKFVTLFTLKSPFVIAFSTILYKYVNFSWTNGIKIAGYWKRSPTVFSTMQSPYVGIISWRKENSSKIKITKSYNVLHFSCVCGPKSRPAATDPYDQFTKNLKSLYILSILFYLTSTIKTTRIVPQIMSLSHSNYVSVCPWCAILFLGCNVQCTKASAHLNI
jgi:hypothetical protein